VIARQVRHPRWAVWNSECLAWHLSSASYQDRLFMAHFAVITFGLVALLGAWHDPLLSMCVAFGLSALLMFVYLGLASFTRQCPVIYLWPDASFIYCPRQTRRAWALRMLLEFIRRAHLSCGAPPRLSSPYRVPKGWGFNATRAALNPHPFLIFSFRR
jgi:hypothetical protein